MKKYLLYALAAICLITTSCTEEIDTSARYVFREETISSYLEKHKQYSEYYRLLGEVFVSKISDTNVKQLLSARGHYTIFAPTNDAIQEYLDSLVTIGLIPEANWDAFESDHVRDSIYHVIVFNSIIDSGNDYDEYEINSLPPATATSKSVEIPLPNMNDRKLIVQYTDLPDSILSYNPHYDRRHTVNLLAIYKFGAKNDWEVSGRWSFGSGFPFTQTQGVYQQLMFGDNIVSDYTRENGVYGIHYAELYKGRLPNYHRLDLGIKRKFSLGTRSILELSLSATNIYSRQNIFYFNRITFERVNQLPILASFGASLSF